MNEINGSPDGEKKAKMMRTLRYIWMVLIPLFGIILLLNLYNWKYNNNSLSGIFSPLTFIFLGLASIVGKEKKALHYIFLGIAIISLLAGITLLFIN